MTINTPTVLAQGGTTTDGNPLLTDSISPSANRFLLAVIYSSHGTAANAVIPTAFTYAGLTWTFSPYSHLEGNQRVTLAYAFTASGAPTPAQLSVDFGRTMQAMGWHILQFAASSVDSAAPIVQFKAYDYASSPGANLSFDLPAAPTPGNGVLAAISAGSNTIDYVAGTGFTQLGDTVPLSTPSMSGAVFWSPGGTRTVAVGSEQAAPNKSLVAIEIKAAAGTNSPPTAVLTASKMTPAAGDSVTLDGSGSTDLDGTVSTYLFTQTAGPTVTLAGSGATRTFTTPVVTTPTTLTFTLRVTDNSGANNTATLSITANPAGLLVKEKTATGGDAFSSTPSAFTVVNGRIQVAAADGVAAFATWESLGLTRAGSRWVGELTGYPTGGAVVLISPQNTAGTRAVDVGINTSGKLYFRDAANVLNPGSTVQTPVPLNTKIRIEPVSDGDTTATIYLFLAGSTTPIDSATYIGPSGTFSNWDRFRVGVSAANPAMPMYYLDDVAVKNTNSQLGPWSGSPAAPAVTLAASKTTGAKGGQLVTLTATATSPTSTIASYSFTASGGIALAGTGNMRTFTVPYKPTAQVLTFAVTVTDANGLTATALVMVNTLPLVFPDGGFTTRGGVVVPVLRGSKNVDNVTVNASTSVGDGTATISGSLAPNGRSVDGVYIGRDGTSSTGGGPWESGLITGLTFSQTFTSLVNGTPYHLTVTPVVLGVRQTPTTVTVTPQATGPTNPSSLMIGMYHAAPSTDPDGGAYKTAFGNYPMCASTYYSTVQVNEAYEIARVQRGTTVFLDFDTKSTPGLIGHIADGDATGLAWLEPYLTSAQNVANASNAANNGTDVFIGFVHEWEVKRNQNVLTDTRDRDPATYAAAWDTFVERARAIAPDCIPILWTGGSDTATIATVMAAITEPPSAVSWDPYVTNAGTFQLPTQRWNAGAQFFTNNADYQQWGSPPLYITETAIDKRKGDTNCAAFYADMPNAMKTLSINGVIVFAVDKTDVGSGLPVEYDIFATLDATPNARTAYGTAVSTIRGGAGVVKPTVITAPVIQGTAKVGQLLSVSTGAWTGTPASYKRQWYVNGVAVVGSTASNYACLSSDVGKMITATVVATNAAGDSLPATSAAYGPVLSSSTPGNTWVPVYTDIDLSTEPAGTDYTDGQRTTTDQSTNRKTQAAWTPDGLMITAQRSGPGAEPADGGPVILSADVMLKGFNVQQHAAIEWDNTMGVYLGPGCFPAAMWLRPNGAGEGEKDGTEYCGANVGKYNEMKTTALFTPYPPSSQTVMRWALNTPGYSATGDRMAIFGGFHSWRLEMTPDGGWVLYRDGIQMYENSTRNHVGSDTWVLDNKGISPNAWTAQMENNTVWYPRITYQMGNSVSYKQTGKGNALGGVIPTSWTKSTMLTSRLSIWKLS